MSCTRLLVGLTVATKLRGNKPQITSPKLLSGTGTTVRVRLTSFYDCGACLPGRVCRHRFRDRLVHHRGVVNVLELKSHFSAFVGYGRTQNSGFLLTDFSVA